MDVCKIAPKLYQFTAIDDCSRMKVVSLYPRRTASNSLLFLDEVVERLPFPIQRIQTDRGREFFAEKFQKRLMDYCIKFRPIKSRSPHLNGKVERTQKTDLEEFYATVNLRSKKLKVKLSEWEFYYNWHRPHRSLDNKAPVEIIVERSSQTPYQEEVERSYDRSRERFQEANYAMDLRLRELKPSM